MTAILLGLKISTRWPPCSRIGYSVRPDYIPHCVYSVWNCVDPVSLRFCLPYYAAPLSVGNTIQIDIPDCDMSDENFFSSPCFGSCDMVKILSVVAVELYILAPFGVIAGVPLEPKLAIYWQKPQF
jgi:hypothetical protein